MSISSKFIITLKKLISKRKRFAIIAILSLSGLLCFNSCENSQKKAQEDAPSWYINQKQNDNVSLYGVAEGYTMEEATRYALAELASKIIVSISSESEMNRQANQNSYMNEIRQKTRQSIEKISFSNYKVSRSKKLNDKFYVEVQVERSPFLNEQKERASVLKRKIQELDASSKKSNIIQRRFDLIKINDLCKEFDLKIRILSGLGYDFELSKNLETISAYQVELSKLTSKILFFVEEDGSGLNLKSLVKNYLNKEGFQISDDKVAATSNMISIKIKSSHKTTEIYGAKISKLKIGFENYSSGNIVASNQVEVTGSSSIDEDESKKAAIGNLEETIKRDGILKVLGII